MVKRYIKVTPVEAIQVTKFNHKKVEEFAFFAKNYFWLWTNKTFY